MPKEKFIPPSCIDVLYDYLSLLQEKGLCILPKQLYGTEVAIIGAGPAGMLAAHELLKMGIKPVIYEASNRIGGRLYSKHFEQVQDKVKPFAELGAMRVPKSSKIFLHYANKMGLDISNQFPSPGIVDTAIFYKNKLFDWKANHPLPSPFKEINFLWEGFIGPVVARIHAEWEKGNLEEVRKLWQKQIDLYQDKSSFQVLKETSPLQTSEQISLFGALGIGGGGFSPFFSLGFLEILRFAVNRYFDDLVFFPNGITEFIEKLYRLPIHSEIGQTALSECHCLKLNSPVVSFDYNVESKNPIIIYKDEKNIKHRAEYRAVIFTGSVPAAQLINITGPTQSNIYLFDDKVRQAIRNSNMLVSSKTFICTETKFWKDKKMPQCILTDDLPRATYFLDYPHTNYGVICMSYTWGVDSLKLHAVDPKDRIIIFKRVFEQISKEINKELQPLNDEVINIDWINQKYQNGTCSVFVPGVDMEQRDLFFQYQSSLTQEDKGVYLAGDTISWSSGWVEGALYSSLNAVYAVAKRLGAQIPSGSPLEINPEFYSY